MYCKLHCYCFSLKYFDSTCNNCFWKLLYFWNLVIWIISFIYYRKHKIGKAPKYFLFEYMSEEILFLSLNIHLSLIICSCLIKHTRLLQFSLAEVTSVNFEWLLFAMILYIHITVFIQKYFKVLCLVCLYKG